MCSSTSFCLANSQDQNMKTINLAGRKVKGQEHRIFWIFTWDTGITVVHTVTNIDLGHYICNRAYFNFFIFFYLHFIEFLNLMWSWIWLCYFWRIINVCPEIFKTMLQHKCSYLCFWMLKYLNLKGVMRKFKQYCKPSS